MLRKRKRESQRQMNGVNGGKDSAGSGTQPAKAAKKKTRKLGRLQETAEAAKKETKKRKLASADATAAII